MTLQEREARQRQHVVAHLALEMRAADDDAVEPAVGAELPAAILVPQEIAGQVGTQRTLGHQLVHHLRKIVGEDPVACGQQAVRVLALRHALAVLGAVADLVPLDQRDALEMVGERPRRAEARHAPAQNNRVPSCCCHDVDPPCRAYAGRNLPDGSLARS